MKRTDFQCVVDYTCDTLDSLYDCVRDSTLNPIERERCRKDLVAVFNFLNEAKQHGFDIYTQYDLEDIKNEVLNAGKI